MALLNVAHRALASIGVGVVRVRDPFREMARHVAGTPIAYAVDGGAYAGATIRRLRSHFPAATIHAFEPQPDTFRRLQSIVRGMPGVALYPCALSDHEGEQAFHVHETAYTSSLLATQVPAMHPVADHTVPLRTLDAVLAAAGCQGANVIKLDVQGYELPALRGAEATLANCHALLAEVNFRCRYEGGCRFEELAGFMGAHGLHLYRLYELAACAHDHGWLHGDALFVRR